MARSRRVGSSPLTRIFLGAAKPQPNWATTDSQGQFMKWSGDGPVADTRRLHLTWRGTSRPHSDLFDFMNWR